VEVLDMLVAFLAVIGILVIVSGLNRRRRDLADGIAPFQPSVSDEAEAWLRRQ
jgi:hypothetical protein